MKKKKNNLTSNNSKSITNNDLNYIGNFTKEFEEDPEKKEVKRLHEKFITSEEDDALSENWTEDQEEQNEIHNNFFDNQPKERSHDIKPPKH